MAKPIYSVRQFNREVRELVESSYKEIWVGGEISNLAAPSSGHLYFSLKDQDAQVRCAFFRGQRLKTSCNVENGQSVHLRGRPSLYETRGEFQIIVDYVEPAGEGILRRRFEQLKNALRQEGLFNSSDKQSLPRMPDCIGVITSPTGAAVHDIISTLRRRYPVANVLIYPTAVQGEGAAEQIAETLKLANAMKASDVLIVARGGGSIEDLWAFNEEIVVRAIHSSQIPVVTGIGHEVDVTLSDFAADYRSETPTAAAESVAPEGTEIMNTVVSLYRRLQTTTYYMIQNNSQHVDLLAGRLRHPIDLLHLYRQQLSILQSSYIFACKTAVHKREIEFLSLTQKLDRLSPKVLVDNTKLYIRGIDTRLDHLKNALINNRSSKLASLTGRLRTLSPEHTLQRGYSILRDATDGHLLASANSVQDGQSLEIEMLGGWLESTVDRVRKDNGSKTLRLSGRNNPSKGNS